MLDRYWTPMLLAILAVAVAVAVMVAPVSADYGDEVAIHCGSAIMESMPNKTGASRACEDARSERALIGAAILLLSLIVGVGDGILHRRSTRLVGSSQAGSLDKAD